MARRRSRRTSRTRIGSPSILIRLAIVVLLGAGLLATGGWTPVVVAVLLVLMLAGVGSLRPSRRRRSRR